MIIEKQIELLILSSIINEASWKGMFEFDSSKYNREKVISRYKELMKEFLEQYALNSEPRGY